MPKPLNAISLYSSLALTGTVVSPELTIPQNVTEGELSLILSSGISELNVYDILVVVEVFENGKWVVRDTNIAYRDIIQGALEPVNIGCAAKIEDLAGKKIRATLSCGQSVLNASITIK